MEMVTQQKYCIRKFPKRARQGENLTPANPCKRVKTTENTCATKVNDLLLPSNDLKSNAPCPDALRILDIWKEVSKKLSLEELPHLERTCKRLHLACRERWMAFFTKQKLRIERIFQERQEYEEIDERDTCRRPSGDNLANESAKVVFFDGSQSESDEQQPVGRWRYIPDFTIDSHHSSYSFSSWDFTKVTVVGNLNVLNCDSELSNNEMILPNCLYLSVTLHVRRGNWDGDCSKPSALLIHLLRYSPKIMMSRSLMFLRNPSSAEKSIMHNTGLKSLRYYKSDIDTQCCISSKFLSFLRSTRLKSLVVESVDSMEDEEINLQKTTCQSLRHLHLGEGFKLSPSTWQELISSNQCLSSVRIFVSDYMHFFECIIPNLLSLFSAPNHTPEKCVLEHRVDGNSLTTEAYQSAYWINEEHVKTMENHGAVFTAENTLSLCKKSLQNERASLLERFTSLSPHPPLKMKSLKIRLCTQPLFVFYAVEMLFLRSFETLQELTLNCTSFSKDEDFERILTSLSIYHVSGRELRHLRLEFDDFSPQKMLQLAKMLSHRTTTSTTPVCRVSLSFSTLCWKFESKIHLHANDGSALLGLQIADNPSDCLSESRSLRIKLASSAPSTVEGALKRVRALVDHVERTLKSCAQEFEQLAKASSTGRRITLNMQVGSRLSYAYHLLCPSCFCRERIYTLKLESGELAAAESHFHFARSQSKNPESFLLEHWIKSEIKGSMGIFGPPCPCVQCELEKKKIPREGVEGREKTEYIKVEKAFSPSERKKMGKSLDETCAARKAGSRMLDCADKRWLSIKHKLFFSYKSNCAT